jgi:RNA polymerase sigma factor (sigma-70 family)
VKTCMADMPPRQRLVATLVWFRGLRARRAAAVLGISEPAISRHLKRARAAVLRCLDLDGDGGLRA